MFRSISLAAAVALCCSAPARGDDAEAKAIAIKVTTAGAALFDAKDAPGIAATFTENARLEALIRDKNASGYRSEVKQGRSEIEGYYRMLFGGGAEFHSRNTIDYAREIGPNLILFTGTFVPDTQSNEPIKLPFVQVRERQGEEWRVVTMQVFLTLEK